MCLALVSCSDSFSERESCGWPQASLWELLLSGQSAYRWRTSLLPPEPQTWTPPCPQQGAPGARCHHRSPVRAACAPAGSSTRYTHWAAGSWPRLHPACWCGRSNKGTQSETSGRAGGEDELPHDPRPVPKARTAWEVHSLTLTGWRIFRANSVGFFSSVLGCLSFVIKHTEEVMLIFNSSCKEEVFVPSLFRVSDSQLGGWGWQCPARTWSAVDTQPGQAAAEPRCLWLPCWPSRPQVGHVPVLIRELRLALCPHLSFCTGAAIPRAPSDLGSAGEPLLQVPHSPPAVNPMAETRVLPVWGSVCPPVGGFQPLSGGVQGRGALCGVQSSVSRSSNRIPNAPYLGGSGCPETR